jgi:putative colanic acid biosynthesis acetyltransferase WcaF
MESTEQKSNPKESNQTVAMEKAPPKRRTVWTTKQRLVRLCWGTFGRLFWVLCPCWRSQILRFFGAKIGKGCTFSRQIEIVIPWNLVVGDDCHIGEYVILYTLGTITLGSRVRIDTRAHLCAGTHDMRDTTFPLLCPPISVGDDSFIGVDAYIAPDISLGANTIVHPRASVYKSFQDGVELQGNPAKIIS